MNIFSTQTNNKFLSFIEYNLILKIDLAIKNFATKASPLTPLQGERGTDAVGFAFINSMLFAQETEYKIQLKIRKD